jgi:hypothetical protein
LLSESVPDDVNRIVRGGTRRLTLAQSTSQKRGELSAIDRAESGKMNAFVLLF